MDDLSPRLRNKMRTRTLGHPAHAKLTVESSGPVTSQCFKEDHVDGTAPPAHIGRGATEPVARPWATHRQSVRYPIRPEPTRGTRLHQRGTRTAVRATRCRTPVVCRH